MATAIDELVIQIKADTKQLKSELDKINGKIRTTGAAGGAAFGAGAGGLGGKLSKMKGPLIAATAGFVAMGVAMTKIAKVGAEFEDLADSLNTVFGSVEAGSDAMQKVLNFAQTTPFQIETVTKAFISLQSAGVEPTNRMLQVFADTASTSTDQLGVFEALVRTVQRSASGGLGLEELNMIMDRGIDVLGILNDELGLTKDSIATFGKTAEGAKLITDALINGLEKKFGGAMESKMDNLSTVASNMTIAFKQLGDQVFKSGLGDFFKSMAARLTTMANAIAKTIAVTGGRATTVDFVTPEFTPREDLMAQRTFAAEAENLKRILERRKELISLNKSEHTNSLSQFGERGSEERKGFENGEMGKTQQANYDAIIARIQRNNSELEILRDTELDILHTRKERLNVDKDLSAEELASLDHKGRIMNAVSLLANEFKKIEGNTKELAFATENWDEILSTKINGKTLPELFGGIEKVKKMFGEVVVATDKTSKTFSESLAPAIQSMSLSFTNDFVNALMQGENALESFKSFSENIVSQIIATFLQMAVINKLLNTIFGVGGFNVQGYVNAPTIGKAGGGTVQKGVPTIVNERGAEIFVPNTGGKILNNMNSKNAMGGGTTVINQSINFATGVVPTVRAEVMKMMPQIADVTKGAVAEAAIRGGNFRRALQGG